MTRRNLKLGIYHKEGGLDRNTFAMLAYFGALIGFTALVAARAFAG